MSVKISDVLSKAQSYANLASLAVDAIASIIALLDRKSREEVTPEQCDDEIAKIDAWLDNASRVDWDRLRGGL